MTAGRTGDPVEGSSGRTSVEEALLAKADRYVRSAGLLADDGDLDSAVSRAYYAQFFAVEALLSSVGLAFSSHRAVIGAFGREFALTGRLDPAFHRHLVAAFEKRQTVEYQVDAGVTATDVSRMLDQTAALLAAARAWIAAAGPPAGSSEEG